MKMYISRDANLKSVWNKYPCKICTLRIPISRKYFSHFASSIDKNHKTIESNKWEVSINRLQERKRLISPFKTGGTKYTHTHCSNIFWSSKFTRCGSIKLDCSAQNFIFKHLGTKQQPHMCPLTTWMVSFLLVLRFYIYHRSVLALPENVSVSSRHKKKLIKLQSLVFGVLWPHFSFLWYHPIYGVNL